MAAIDPPLPTSQRDTGAVESFTGTDRYLLLRRLGAGAFGTVYEAYDRRLERRVALKLLSLDDPESLYRFKREFRALADLRHPNVVRLEELAADDGRWFFTMEPVDGTPFLAYARPVDADGNPASDYVRLRRALVQLAEGLGFLHRHARLHGDLKPSNVLVTPEGRLVLLDFSLVGELALPKGPRAGAGTGRELLEPGAHGTLAYLSPERLDGTPNSPAGDWFAVGVMLFEALTGSLPILHRSGAAAPDPRSVTPGVPVDLAMLCRALLDPLPDQRPTGDEVLRHLAPWQSAREPPDPRRAAAADGPPVTPLVRHHQLEALREALRATRRGLLTTVAVSGPTGIGKTTLVERFLDEVRRQEPAAVILTGRCSDRETVPFKALDRLIDALSRHLRGLGRGEVEALLPRDALALARVFPVLTRVPAIARAQPRVLSVASPVELKLRAFAALRELLARLAARAPLIVFVDDLQWGDADSAGLLAELHRPPDPPALLDIGAFRSEDVATSPLLALTLPLAAPPGSPVRILELPLGPLTVDQAAELATHLLAASPRPERPLGPALAAAAGHPWLLARLLEHEVDDLERLAQRLVGALGEDAREVLAALVGSSDGLPLAPLRGHAVTIDPATTDALASAAHSSSVPTSSAAVSEPVDQLLAASLLRIGGGDDPERVLLAHEPLREPLRAVLGSARCRTASARLLTPARGGPVARPQTDPADAVRAATNAAAAAEHAASGLAFDRAARLFRLALSLLPPNHPRTLELRQRLGETLAHAGFPRAAADELLAVAQAATGGHRFDLERRAAELLLLAGHLDSGRRVLVHLLARAGLRLPRTRLAARLVHTFGRASLHLRGKWPTAAQLAPNSQTLQSSATTRRIDACWTAAVGLRTVDPEVAQAFQTRQLLLAVDAGDPQRLARALAFDPAFVAAGGRRTAARAQQMLARAELAVRSGGDDAVRGLAALTAAMVACGQGRWKACHEHATTAVEVLSERASGSGWEVSAGQYFQIMGLLYSGRWDQLVDHLPALVRAAHERGNLYNETLLRPWMAGIALLAADDPDAAEDDLAAATSHWYRQQFHYQHANVLLARAHIALYRRRPDLAWQTIEREWPGFVGSLVRKVQFIWVTCLDLRVRTAIALLTDPAVSNPPARRLHTRIERDLTALARERLGWAGAVATLQRAGLATLDDRPEAALLLLEQAERELAHHDMELLAAIARLRRGQLLDGEAAARLRREAEIDLRARRVRNPFRMAAILAPGRYPAGN